MDGAGNVLAHTFQPENGDIHLDDDETFTTSAGASGIRLSWVMLHEIGHALGNTNYENFFSISDIYVYFFISLSLLISQTIYKTLNIVAYNGLYA